MHFYKQASIGIDRTSWETDIDIIYSNSVVITNRRHDWFRKNDSTLNKNTDNKYCSYFPHSVANMVFIGNIVTTTVAIMGWVTYTG